MQTLKQPGQENGKSPDLHDKLTLLGFEKNTKAINGFIPHYTLGKHCLFLLKSSATAKRTIGIKEAFKNTEYKLCAVVEENAPMNAALYWLCEDQTVLLIFKEQDLFILKSLQAWFDMLADLLTPEQ